MCGVALITGSPKTPNSYFLTTHYVPLVPYAHKGFDVGHGGGAVLGKELDDGAADDGTIADFNALNRES